jgi:4-alpha-glucanotransferase
VATSYIGADQNYYEIDDSAILKVLKALDVKCSSDEEIAASIKAAEQEVWLTPVKKTVVEIEGYGSEVDIYLPTILFSDIEKLNIRVGLEEGTFNGDQYLPVRNVTESLEEKVINQVQFEHRVFKLSKSLPAGYHTILLDIPSAGKSITYTAHLIISPHCAPVPTDQMHGFMLQFYSERSRDSWGVGDFADLNIVSKDMKRYTGADFLLINPTHTDVPILPQTPSPYLPSSRRWLNPIYIRPNDITEAKGISEVQDFARMSKGLNLLHSALNRDAAWSLKKSALKAVFNAGFSSDDRARAFEDFVNNGGHALHLHALWCALCDRYGIDGDFAKVSPSDDSIQQFAKDNLEQIKFYKWLQFIADEQLGSVQETLKSTDAKIGLIADLAVGVHPDGADVWAHRDAFVTGVSVGAPPDLYNQVGQDWSEPPLSPRVLEETGYEIFHDLVRTTLKNAGALRIDHILGMFRLWYVPVGASPKDGAYVYYNHDALIGILTLEATRAGAFIIGEDMGVKPSGALKYLQARGILGTSVLWFEREKDGKPRRSENLRELCLSTVTTHDIPPTLGYIQGEHVRIRAELDLLSVDPHKAKRDQEDDLARETKYLNEAGYLHKSDCDDEVEVSIAMQRSLFDAPSKLVGLSLVDFVGENRAQNQPGTSDEYPNWRVPLEDLHGDLVFAEDLYENETFKRFATSIEQIAKYYKPQMQAERNL